MLTPARDFYALQKKVSFPTKHTPLKLNLELDQQFKRGKVFYDQVQKLETKPSNLDQSKDKLFAPLQ